jgi:hypothetical protein
MIRDIACTSKLLFNIAVYFLCIVCKHCYLKFSQYQTFYEATAVRSPLITVMNGENDGKNDMEF